MASGAPKALGPSIPAASSPNINLSTNMVSEAILQHLILKIFLREHALRPPSACVLTHAPSSVPPPNRKYLPLPMPPAMVVVGMTTVIDVREAIDMMKRTCVVL